MNHIAPTDLSHNQGPATEAEALRLRLQEDHADLIARVQALSEAASRVPATIDSDELCGKASDFIKQMRAAAKAADNARVKEKAPYLEAGKVVDAFFKQLAEKVDLAAKPIVARAEDYMKAKAAEERRRREEEARRVEEERRLAEERARTAAETMQTDQDLDVAVEAETVAAQLVAEEEARRKDAEAKVTDLARTRGDYGGVATLATRWTFKDLNRHAIDLEALRQYLPQDAIEKAVRAAIRAGVRDLRGVTIFQDETAVIR